MNRDEFRVWRADWSGWRPFQWRVYVREWSVRVLDGIAATTDLIMVVSPPRWLWIKFLAWCAGSRSERVRVFAMTRWKRMQVLYWRSLQAETNELPQVSRVARR